MLHSLFSVLANTVNDSQFNIIQIFSLFTLLSPALSLMPILLLDVCLLLYVHMCYYEGH